MLKFLCAFNIFALIISNKTSRSHASGRSEKRALSWTYGIISTKLWRDLKSLFTKVDHTKRIRVISPRCWRLMNGKLNFTGDAVKRPPLPLKIKQTL